MADNQGKKLRQYIDINRIKIADLLEKLEMSRGKLYGLFDKEQIKSEDIELLKKAGVDFMNESIYEALPAYIPEKKGNIIYVPLFAYGGFLHGYANKVFMDSLTRFSLPGIHGEHFAFEVQGSSMMPYAHPGDIVISRKEEHLEWMVKGRPYVLQTIDGILLKIFDRIEGGKALFKSADDGHKHPVLALKEIKGVYQVVKILKDFIVSN